MNWQLPIGANVEEGGVHFRVWAEAVREVEAVLFGPEGQEIGSYPLQRHSDGHFEGFIEGIGDGARYMYRLDGSKLRPDPASRFQPESVHGPSQVVSSAYNWQDDGWQGLPLEEMIIYEVHIGTATPEGTFTSFIEKLDYLKSLGVTTIEIMPVGDFPGERNWGYDGVSLYAPARPYGGPQGFKRLVEAAHERGLAVILDVVYNHLGPDGNYLRDFSSHYYTQAKKTPWGDALDYTAEAVREFFISNALYWAHEYHLDGLRLDATHAILDDSPVHILAELVARVRTSLPPTRQFVIFAEDERNEVKVLLPPEEGGLGLDGVWADDFHHEIRSNLAGDNEGYYADYSGEADEIAQTLNRGWFFAGQASRVSGQKRGTQAPTTDPPHFVYTLQNHDQIGNRAVGDRLNQGIGLDAFRAASALLLLSPYTPLLFQGQEWAASTPFAYFTDHNEELGKLITAGRTQEFASFSGFQGLQVPDPQAFSTFQNSKLNWRELEEPDHAHTLTLYHDLLALRRNLPILRHRRRQEVQSAAVDSDAIALRYSPPGSLESLLILVNLKGTLDLALSAQAITTPPPNQTWQLLLSTDDPRYGGDIPLAQARKGIEEGQAHSATPVTYVLAAGA